MSKKHIDTTQLQNDLAGASHFFPKRAEQPELEQESQQESIIDRKSASVIASTTASKSASIVASPTNDIIARVRKTVRSAGKEVSFVRLSVEEKQLLTDIVFTYKRQGVKTSENEINRIALNYLLEDYQDNGQNSILVKVIEALLA